MQSHPDQNNAMHCCAILCTVMHFIAGCNVAACQVHAVYSKEYTELPSVPPTSSLASKTRTREVSTGLLANTPWPIAYSRILFYPQRYFLHKELEKYYEGKRNSIWGRRTVWW